MPAEPCLFCQRPSAPDAALCAHCTVAALRGHTPNSEPARHDFRVWDSIDDALHAAVLRHPSNGRGQ